MHKQLLENKMMKNNNRTVALNMIANVLSFGVSLIISFFLTPYITKNVGTEAYGLVILSSGLGSKKELLPRFNNIPEIVVAKIYPNNKL